MDVKKVLLVKYGEISLRKGNRSFFEHQLLDAIRNNIKKANHSNIRVVREQGRFLIEDIHGDINADEILPLIKHIFGITGFCRAIKTSARDISDLKPIALEFFRESLKHLSQQPKSFRIETKRSDKKYPLSSNEISAAIGDPIFHSDLNLTVNLHINCCTLRTRQRRSIHSI